MPYPENFPAFAVADKDIAPLIGMSLAWVRKDRATKRILPFFRIGESVRYDVATVRNVMLARMEGGTTKATSKVAA